MKSIEQEIFEIIHTCDELLSGPLHIIDNTPTYPDAEGEQSFRIYHKDGYCIDVIKQADEEEPDIFHYSVLQEWPEFKKASMLEIIQFLKVELNLL